jgi:hypothetical protein
MTFNVKAFALACGLIWGAGLCAITWWIIIFDGSGAGPTFIGSVYRGYSVTPLGSLVGLLWGFFDGSIGGAFFALLYNFLTARFATE